MKTLLSTNDSWRSLVQRAVLAAVIFPHGAQKLFGWFGGYGFHASMAYFTETEHVPALLAFLVVMAESIGALLLAAGALTRVAAAGIAAVMLGAIFLVHAHNGFFMNWFGAQSGEGFEYHLLALALALPLVAKGGGLFSIDALLSESRFASGARTELRGTP